MILGSFPEAFLEKVESRGSASAALVEQFVTEGRAEDLYLDFKEKEDPTRSEPSQNDKRNLAKASSGFAHSDGGVLIWGVEARREGNDSESPDVARSLKPIKKLDGFYTHLNSLLSMATKPAVSGVQNVRIRLSPRADEGCVVTYVPVGREPTLPGRIG